MIAFLHSTSADAKPESRMLPKLRLFIKEYIYITRETAPTITAPKKQNFSLY